MLIKTDITLFDLKTTPEHIIVGGGGGNTIYGKENGIIVIEKRNKNKQYYYKTEDFILSLNVYLKNAPYDEYSEDKDSLEINRDSTDESLSSVDLKTGFNTMPDDMSTIGRKLNNLESISKLEKSKEFEKSNEQQPVNTEEKSKQPVNTEEKSKQPINTEGKSNEQQPVNNAENSNEQQPINNAEKSNEQQPVNNAENSNEQQPVNNAENSNEQQPINNAENSNEQTIKKYNKLDDSLYKKSDETIYIFGITEFSFYFLRFKNQKFKLLMHENYKIKYFHLTKHLFLLINHKVYGFNNIIKNYKKVTPIPLEKIILESSDEEYLYNIYKSNNRLIFKREFGIDDITDDWDNFFLYNKKIHKVLYENNKSTFVFNNKKYSYNGKIGKIFVLKNGNLVFFITKNRISYLYFLSLLEKVFLLPKITAINYSKNTVIVATFEGTSIVYESDVFYSKSHISDLPITGVSIEGNIAYFSIITGCILKKKIRKSKYYYGFIIALFVILIGYFINYYKIKTN